MTAYAMPKIGDVLAGKYRLEKVAGEGGMGTVYAAEHLVLSQRVAVKVLLPDAAASDAVVERFAREARAAARIQSQHVARVMDAGSLASGAPFLVMEYLEGCDLEELKELQGTLPVGEVVDYLLQALEALAHAHAVGIIHRDLKPANLFLACQPDGGNMIKMVDFGISKTIEVKPEEKKLTGQHVLGSPVYMSPEQLRNAKEMDGRADLWSLGVVAYELLSGVTPFDGDGVGEIFAAILGSDCVPLVERNPKVPAALSEIIGKCLRREPKERWADAAALAKALVPFGTGAWTSVVEKAELVLARSRAMRAPATPFETRLVVQAIEEAAQRAITSTSTSNAPGAVSPTDTSAIPLSTRKGKRMTVRLAELARRKPARRAGLVAAALLVVGAVTAVGAVRASRADGVGAPMPIANVATATAVGSSGTATPSQPAPPASRDSAEEPAMVLDLPAEAPRERARATKSSTKPQRPKFLNTRE